MGATTKSITGLFANVCGRRVCDRMVREQIAAGRGTRLSAAQGYLPLSLFGLRHSSWRAPLASLAQITCGVPQWLGEARDQARWLLKRLGGLLTSALPNTSGVLSPAWCPARRGSQASGRPQAGSRRFHG